MTAARTCVRFAVCCVVAVAFAWPAAAAASSKLEIALTRARSSALADARAWHRLLHYRPNIWGGHKSEVDADDFFLAAHGKTDPAAELAATLRAFFAPLDARSPDAHALCRFPARLHWLRQRLGLTELEPPRCRKRDAFLAQTRAESASLIYAANALEYPASAFGHTFLHVGPRPSGTPPVVTGAGVDYQADTDTDNPLLYAFKGLTGLFIGRFRVGPVTTKLDEYGEQQDRDLWIYELSLERSEVEQLMRHLWELMHAHIDYYYFTENCSYHVLGALEAAAPRLELTRRVKFVVLPMDTIKAAAATPGLVRGVRYLPSHATRARARFEDTSAHAVPWSKAPDRGHGTMRALLGAGSSTFDSRRFATLGYRLALHDLADPTSGHPELAQVQFLDTRVRYSIPGYRLWLESITFAELIALHGLTAHENRASWRARAHGGRVYDRRCERGSCFAHGLNASLGATLASRDANLAAFLMADTFVLFSGGFDGLGGSFVSAGIGPHLGLRARLSDRTALLVTATYSILPAQPITYTYEVTGRLRSALGRDFALGVEMTAAPLAVQGELLSYIYF